MRKILAASVAVVFLYLFVGVFAQPTSAVTDAPASFELVTNGLTTQEEFDANLENFREPATVSEGEDKGLGPTHNAFACVDCHNNPTTGGESQITELRAGHWDIINRAFVAPPGGTLIRQKAINPDIQQRAPDQYEIRARRRSTSLFSLAYIEFVRDATILAVQAAQPPELRGYVQYVSVTTGVSGLLPLEPFRAFKDLNTGTVRATGGPLGLTTDTRIGRFGWKCQHGSLLDFAADADLNEKGITSVIQPSEALAVDGSRLAAFDKVADPEDEPTTAFPFGRNITAYTRLMRSMQAAPPSYALNRTAGAIAGRKTFTAIGCAVCHTPTYQTCPTGIAPKGMQITPAALGDKIVTVYSDLMLHDIGTGDGIVQGDPAARNMLRTAILAGVRCRTELMHDGLSQTFRDCIDRHHGQAEPVRRSFFDLPATDQSNLLEFLNAQ